MKVKILLVSLLLLSGCATMDISEPDEYGFRWYKSDFKCESVEITEVQDVTLHCSKGACACLLLNRADNTCAIYLPKNPHPALLKHELRHANGELHLRNPNVVCPTRTITNIEHFNIRHREHNTR